MKKTLAVIFLFFIIIFASGCFREPAGKEFQETSDTIGQLADGDPSPVYDIVSDSQVAVVVWEELNEEKTSEFGFNNIRDLPYVMMTVSFDKIFFETFDTYSKEQNKSTHPDSIQQGFLAVPKPYAEKIILGTKQMVLLDYIANCYGTDVYGLTGNFDEDGSLKMKNPVFNIVDNKIVFPDEYEFGTAFWLRSASKRLENDTDYTCLFEDGMEIDRFPVFLNTFFQHWNSQ